MQRQQIVDTHVYNLKINTKKLYPRPDNIYGKENTHNGIYSQYPLRVSVVLEILPLKHSEMIYHQRNVDKF